MKYNKSYWYDFYIDFNDWSIGFMCVSMKCMAQSIKSIDQNVWVKLDFMMLHVSFTLRILKKNRKTINFNVFWDRHYQQSDRFYACKDGMHEWVLKIINGEIDMLETKIMQLFQGLYRLIGFTISMLILIISIAVMVL